MEDSHLAIAPFSPKKLGLFAVFDGHGGTKSFIQGQPVPSLSRITSLKNFWTIKIFRKANIKWPWNKHFCEWMSSWGHKREKLSYTKFKISSCKRTMPVNNMMLLSLDVLEMLYLWLHPTYTVQMQAIPEQLLW